MLLLLVFDIRRARIPTPISDYSDDSDSSFLSPESETVR